MIYVFKCDKCGKIVEYNLFIKDYEDLIKNEKKTEKLKCPDCGYTLRRVYSNIGIKTNDGFKS